jgi:Na+/H+ antiporter NhaD/arsenite permease-like protein
MPRRRFRPFLLRRSPAFGIACLLLLAGGLTAVPAGAGPAAGPGEASIADAGEAAGSPPAHAGEAEEHLGSVLPLWSVLPFAGILLSIALFPLAAPHFWHRRFGWVTAAWAALFALPFLWRFGAAAAHEILHIYLLDYFPFIILLGSLFTVSGGILVRGNPRGTPARNALLLALGTLLASWVGTTGAAMLLVRPLLRANAARRQKAHTLVFFIFLVANVGGALTPLGDPPLFLGFLHGVPFFWTLSLLPHMSLVAGVLLAVYYLLDRYHYGREKRLPSPRPPAARGPAAVSFAGLHNLLFLGGILVSVLLSGYWHPGSVHLLGTELPIQNLARDGALLLLALCSFLTTPRALREENRFTWFPIKEVAYLFAGIFMTIIPALAMLKAGSAGAFRPLLELVRTPAQYFWTTGALSSFLDNAPTYLTFFSSALGRFFPGLPERQAVASLIADHGLYLQAISAGAVFMGANTYIGNAPNFMVKSIAEEAGVPMPSFFGYLLRYSLPILIPLFLLVHLVFF